MSIDSPVLFIFILKLISAPSLLPIQFLCCIFIFSRKLVSSKSLSNLSAYFVIASIHCSFSLFSTLVPQRSQQPSTTSSFASPVRSFGHQLTDIFFLYAKPFFRNCKKIHCVYL